MRRDAIYVALLALLPTVAFGFFALFFSNNAVENLPVAVLDRDRTPLSRKMVSMLDATAAVEVRFEPSDEWMGRRLMDEGEAYAVVLIPQGFGAAVGGGRSARVELYDSGLNISANGFIAKDVQTVVATFAGGVELQLLQSLGESRTQAMAQTLPLQFAPHILFNPTLDYGGYLAPCFMAMMLMIFSLLATVYAIGSELRLATADEWLRLSRGSMGVALAGKLLPVWLVLVWWAVVMLFLLFALLGVVQHGSWVVLVAATLLLVVCYQAVAMVVVALTANMRLALSLGGGYCVLAFTFSGLTFPEMAMAEPLRWLTHLFPFTYYVRIFIDQAVRGAPIGYALVDMSRMALFCVVPLLVVGRLRHICCERAYWGRR